MHKQYFNPKLMLVVFVLFSLNCLSQTKQSRIFVFTRTCGYVHESIPKGVGVITELGLENNFIIKSSDDPRIFLSDELFSYDAIIFLSTTLDILNQEQQKLSKGCSFFHLQKLIWLQRLICHLTLRMSEFVLRIGFVFQGLK